ncbi:hypothetical protein C0993_010921, partial [Termitomyces sp. T159_Od127]
PTVIKKPHTLLGNSTAVGDDVLLANLKVQSIEEKKEIHDDKLQDVKHFFHDPIIKQVNGREKRYCICKICPSVEKKMIIKEATTLWCHLEVHHSGKYQKWAKENKFKSKLPDDVKKWKVDAEHVIQTLDNDLKEKKLKECAVKYTHKPIQEHEDPKFREMIDVTSYATDSVKIPGQKSMQTAIKQSFCEHLKKLKTELN